MFTSTGFAIFGSALFLDMTLKTFLPILIEPHVPQVVGRIQSGKVVVKFFDKWRVGFD